MNLDELRTVQSKERQKDSLQHLRPSFYQEVGDYIANLEAERECIADAADDPFSSPEVGRLTDEIETAKDVVDAIYERRMGKLVKQASLAAAGMPADDEGLTAEESDLFDDLVDRIQGNKTRVLDVLEGKESVAGGAANDASDSNPNADTKSPDRSADAPESSSPASNAPSDSVSVADAMGGELPADETEASQESSSADETPPPPPPDEPPLENADAVSDGADSEPPIRDDEPSALATETDADAQTDTATAGDESTTDVDRVTVKITRDVGSILGIDDREYTLATDDVVTLPEQNATPLVEREAAEQLE
ncbi:hypothetical protein [Natronosalvus vescus]|uniref:hypothetical protein n=1 Tax=Natronosalvus vescus TaxID=2953881 RepID=UPI0020914370|nr:hypothetical protein [Natronosalvus vescus]